MARQARSRPAAEKIRKELRDPHSGEIAWIEHLRISEWPTLMDNFCKPLQEGKPGEWKAGMELVYASAKSARLE